MVRAQHGDRHAFELIIDAIGGRLESVAIGVLRDPQLAKDATQQALLAVWQHLPRLRDPARFDAWAYRILVHACRAEGRGTRRWLPNVLAPVEEPQDDTDAFGSVDTKGIIHAFAGTGTAGFSGDGGPAPAAEFGFAYNGMTGPAVAPDGGVLLGDPGNARIRRVDPSGVINTYFKNLDELRPSPYGLAVDPAGVLYIGDWQAGRVFRVDPAGTLSTIAGAGVEAHYGDCVPATEAGLSGPDALAVHDGALYILEQGASRIRVVVP